MTLPIPEQPLGQFLDLVAARQPAPGGGTVAAVTAAASAGLAAMAARFSDTRLDDSGRLAERADRLRHRAFSLAGEDAEAYAAVLAAQRLPREPDPAGRAARVRQALHRAAEIPLDLAGVAAQVAELGVRLADDGNPNLKGDAVSATLLAEAAARSAAALVRINAERGGLGPDLPARADAHVLAAARARQRLGPADRAVTAPAGGQASAAPGTP
jgi:formiminotetrahydrofolate cyclodeaminase